MPFHGVKVRAGTWHQIISTGAVEAPFYRSRLNDACGDEKPVMLDDENEKFQDSAEVG